MFGLFLGNLSVSASGSCDLDPSQRNILKNASFYYKSERYLEAEIELNRILMEKPCEQIRIFQIFSYLRQNKRIDSLILEKDFEDIRFRVLYDFESLIRAGRHFALHPAKTGCKDSSCRLENLEAILVRLIAIRDWEELGQEDYPNEISLSSEEEARFREVTEKARERIREESKSPLASGTFSAVIPGLGQVYSNQFAEGLSSFFVNLIVLSAAYALYIAEPSGVLFYLVSGVSLVTYTSNIVGAYSAANRNNNYWKYEALGELKRNFISISILENEILKKLPLLR